MIVPTPHLNGEEVHLLKKDLLARQLRYEITQLLSSETSIGSLLPGSPNRDAFPLLSPLFCRIVVPFPPCRAADKGPLAFWGTVGRFLGLLQRVDSGGTALTMARRDVLANKLVDALAAMLGKSVVCEEEPTPVHGGVTKQEAFQGYMKEVEWKISDIRIERTTTIKKKGLFRSGETLKYEISSKLNGRHAVVERDFHAFKSLHKQLVRKPKLIVPPLPTIEAKDTLTAYLDSVARQPVTNALRDFLGQSSPVDNDTDPEAARKRAEEIQVALDMFRDELLNPSGIPNAVKTITEATEIMDLPSHYQLSIEWWKICAAAALYRAFVEDARAPDHLRRLKTFHSRAPYRSWAAILRGTNPVMVVKVLGNILLARPFGGLSWLQRMMIGGVQDEMNATLAELNYLANAIRLSPEQVERCRLIVENAPAGGYDDETAKYLLPEVLGYEPHPQSPEAQGTEKILDIYWTLRRLRQIQELLKNEVVVHIAKDLLAITYKPLAEAYRAADPGGIVRDTARFIEDLLHVSEREQAKAQRPPEENAQNGTAAPPLRPYMALLSRHENKIFRHVRQTLSAHTSQANALLEIAKWMDDIANFFRGVGPKINLHSILSSDLDVAGLHRDLEKLKHRKTERRRKHGDRISSRIRGVTKGDVLDEDLDDFHDVMAELPEVDLRGLWSHVGNEGRPEPVMQKDAVGTDHGVLPLQPRVKNGYRTTMKQDWKRNCANL
ncbi:hypothetical protein BC832DRAFT_540678 [Gaertneriomyces semiglobifer]|nr:hypothetical protein BC832DRAFT_540678 [Gaertneriomyces semiglobifer]